MAGPLREEIGVVDPLGSGENLLASHKHVVGVGVLHTTHLLSYGAPSPNKTIPEFVGLITWINEYQFWQKCKKGILL
jgi:hypothetical protein